MAYRGVKYKSQQPTVKRADEGIRRGVVGEGQRHNYRTIGLASIPEDRRTDLMVIQPDSHVIHSV